MNIMISPACSRDISHLATRRSARTHALARMRWRAGMARQVRSQISLHEIDNYTFGTKEAKPEKDSLVKRMSRMESSCLVWLGVGGVAWLALVV